MLFSCAFAVLIAVKAWHRRTTSGALPTFFLMLTILLWSVAASAECAVDELATKLICYDVEFIGFAITPIIWVIMLLDYLGYQRFLTRRYVVLASIIPLLSLLLCWTNPLHGWMFAAQNSNAENPPYLLLTFHAGFWVFVAYIYLLALVGVLLCLQAALTAAGVYRRQAFTLLIGGIIPLVVSTFDISYTILPSWNLTPDAFLITGGMMVWGMYRYRLWDLTPVAYQVIVQKMRDGVIVVNADRRIVEVNPAACAMLDTGYSALIGQPMDGMLAKLPGFTAAHFSKEDTRLSCEVPHSSFSALDIQINPMQSSSRKRSCWLVVMRDMSEQKRLEHELFTLAHFDALTGLPNRVLLQDRLERALRRDRRHQTHTGVIFLDLDRFKEINDMYGHAYGDEVLRQAAERLTTAVRESDTVARFGGDEFVLVLPDMESRDALIEMAERIHELFIPPFRLHGQVFALTPSLGLTLTPEDGMTVEALLQHADTAMYRAKAEGGGHYAFFSESPAAKHSIVA